MTDTSPRDLIKRLADEFEGWIMHAEIEHIERAHALVDEARAYLAQPNPKGPTDEELNSKSSPNNLQIRSSDLDVTIALVQQWTDEIYGGPGAVVGSGDICLAKLAAQYGADQELEACVDWISKQDWTWTSAQLRAARRPKPPSLKKRIAAEIENGTACDRESERITRDVIREVAVWIDRLGYRSCAAELRKEVS